MKRSFLITGFVALIVGISGAAAITDEYITNDNINFWKQESEQYIKGNIDITALKKIMYQAQWPSGSISAQDKVYLKDFQRRATKAAYNKANSLYLSGNYADALKFYQVVKTHETYADNNDFVKSLLNMADITFKQGKSGAVNEITSAIGKSPSDSSIAKFIDSNINRFSYNDMTKIAARYSSKYQQSNAIKYYKRAMDMAPGEVERNKMQSNIAICEKEQSKAERPADNIQISKDALASSVQLFTSSIKKYNYSDISGALSDLERAHKLNPNCSLYDLLYPIFAVSANNYNNAVTHLNAVIEYEIAPFRKSNSNYHTAYEFRGGLKLVMGNYTGSIADYSTALKNSADDFSNAWQGLIVSYLISGNIDAAKAEINKYNKNSYYYQFADCTTYPDKILLNIGKKGNVAYNSNLNNELINGALYDALSSYASKISNLYSGELGNTSIEIH